MHCVFEKNFFWNASAFKHQVHTFFHKLLVSNQSWIFFLCHNSKKIADCFSTCKVTKIIPACKKVFCKNCQFKFLLYFCNRDVNLVCLWTGNASFASPFVTPKAFFMPKFQDLLHFSATIFSPFSIAISFFCCTFAAVSSYWHPRHPSGVSVTGCTRNFFCQFKFLL